MHAVLLAKGSDLVRVLAGRIQARPRRSWRDRIDPGATPGKIRRQRFRQCVNPALGGQMVEQGPDAGQPGFRSGIDDRRTRFQVRQHCLDDRADSAACRLFRSTSRHTGNVSIEKCAVPWVAVLSFDLQAMDKKMPARPVACGQTKHFGDNLLSEAMEKSLVMLEQR